MALFEVPIPDAANGPFEIEVELDEITYTIDFKYNNRESRWYIDVLLQSGERLVSGAKVVTNFPLLRYFGLDRRHPLGDLIAADFRTPDAPPNLAELGEEVPVNYDEETT